jgi:hypothetical protein
MVAMGNVAYVSSVRIERVKGPLRRAWLPATLKPAIQITTELAFASS